MPPKGTKHDFLEFAYSKRVVEDMPKIISVYRKLLPVLYQYQQYTTIWNVIQSVEDSKLLAELQLTYYQTIYEKKGRIS